MRPTTGFRSGDSIISNCLGEPGNLLMARLGRQLRRLYMVPTALTFVQAIPHTFRLFLFFYFIIISQNYVKALQRLQCRIHGANKIKDEYESIRMM